MTEKFDGNHTLVPPIETESMEREIKRTFGLILIFNGSWIYRFEEGKI